MSWLTSIKLTIGQWVGVVAAATIGLLVTALRLQGSRLHASQVALLREQFGRSMDKQDAKVESAKEKFLKALEEYEASR